MKTPRWLTRWWSRGAHRAANVAELPEGNGHAARARLAVEQRRLEVEQVRTASAFRNAGQLPAAADRFGSLIERTLGAQGGR